MIAVILFFVVIVVAAILLGNWATKLDNREKALTKQIEELDAREKSQDTLFAQLCAKEESVRKKQKDADDAWQKCLEEGDRLMEKQHELEAREAEIEAKEASLKQVNAAEVPDIIEPVDEPAKPVKKARRAKK